MSTVRCKALAALAAAVGMSLTAGTAFAGVTYYSPFTSFEDDDLDRLVNNDLNPQTDSPTTIDVGDELIAVLEFNQTYTGGANSPIAPEELTGYSHIRVASKTSIGSGQYAFTFAPVATSGEMVWLYLDGAPDLDVFSCVSVAACELAAQNGPAYISAGFSGDDDEFWTAFGSDNIVTAVGAPDTISVATLQFALSIITNNSGIDFQSQVCSVCNGTDMLIDVIGGGVIKGGDNIQSGAQYSATNPTGYFARSDIDFRVALVPEPGSLVLLATGLIAAGFSFRRRRKAIA